MPDGRSAPPDPSCHATAPRAVARSQERECPTEEVRHQIRVAMRLLVERLQPIRVRVSVRGDQRVLPGKWRIANDCIKATSDIAFVIRRENLREFQLPMERHHTLGT